MCPQATKKEDLETLRRRGGAGALLVADLHPQAGDLMHHGLALRDQHVHLRRPFEKNGFLRSIFFFRRDVLRDALRKDQASSNAWP